jgi:RNA polymerase sigma-70 factor (ECF subfamily)
MAEIDDSRPAGPGRAESLVRRHQADLWRYLRFLGCEAAAAEDLCQEAFLAALRHGIEERPAATATAWLRTTARNLFRMQLRRLRRRVDVEQLDGLDAAYDVQAGGDVGASYRAALQQCLASLNARGREVLRLRFGEAMPRPEMARALALTEEGVKTLLRRVKAALRACIEQRRNEA